MHMVMEYVAAHPQDLYMLLFRASGSSLVGFKEEVIEKFTGVLADWFAGSMPGRAPSRLFVRSVAGFYVTSIERMLLERPTMEQAGAYMGEFLKFIYGGWNSLMTR
jgi:hypothetical protein